MNCPMWSKIKLSSDGLMKLSKGVLTLTWDFGWQVRSRGQIMPFNSPPLPEAPPFTDTSVITAVKKVCGKSSSVDRPSLWKVNSEQRRCQTPWIPHWLLLLKLFFNLRQDGKKKCYPCRPFVGAFRSFVIQPFSADVEASEVGRAKQGRACVCVSIRTRGLSGDGRELADEFSPLCSICSILFGSPTLRHSRWCNLACFAPADKNWACSWISEDGDSMPFFGGRCHDFTLFNTVELQTLNNNIILCKPWPCLLETDMTIKLSQAPSLCNHCM